MIINTHQKFYLVLFQISNLGQLISNSPNTLKMMNTVNTEFPFVEVWFRDQVSKALEIEDDVNLALIIR